MQVSPRGAHVVTLLPVSRRGAPHRRQVQPELPAEVVIRWTLAALLVGADQQLHSRVN